MADTASPAGKQVSSLVEAALSARLTPGAAAPIVVAFSGGGDFLAMLLAAQAWTDRAARRLIVVTVDHRLQASGDRWAAWCADRAERLGIEHRTVAWTSEKPATGLATAARLARHRLIAEVARAAGAQVILMGHTADDRLEAEAMTRAGARVSAPRAWSPAPVWPQGRGLFILRPLIELRRAEIRAALEACGERWIDDPANEDLARPRARARAELAGGGAPAEPQARPDLTALAQAAEIGPSGELTLPLAALAAAAPAARQAFLAVAVLCVGGGETPPRSARIAGLADRIAAGPITSSLCGARVLDERHSLLIVREVGDARSRPAPALRLTLGVTEVWDGRFEVRALAPNLILRPLSGLASRLPSAQRKALRALHPAVRRALSALVDERGSVTSPALSSDDRLHLRSLVAERLAGACGLTQTDASIWRVAERPWTS